MRGAISLKQSNNTASELSAVVSWQTKLRQAMFNAVTEQDVEQIVRAQVEAAKKGDKAALQFVTDVLLGSKQPITLKQENHYSVEDGARIEAGNGRRRA